MLYSHEMGNIFLEKSSLQIQFNFDTNAAQILYKNSNLIQIQFKLDTNAIKIRINTNW